MTNLCLHRYFSSAWCCMEFCQAVFAKIPIIFVHVECSTWNGKRLPDIEDVPEKVRIEGKFITPRASFVEYIETHGPLEPMQHTRTYFNSFVVELSQKLEPPAVIEFTPSAREMFFRRSDCRP